MPEKTFKLGRYGAGTLWCLKCSGETFIAFNSIRIAKRVKGEEIWAPLMPGWKVTPVGNAEIQVQYNNGDGVIISLRGGGSI
jgi:hypothetical protein